MIHNKTCLICTCKFITNRVRQVVCNKICRRQLNIRIANDSYRNRFPRNEFKCKECDILVMPNRKNKFRKFCSLICSRKNVRRTCRKKTKLRKRKLTCESVNPFKVFDSYNWTCPCCGINTPKGLRGTLLDNAPELDHIKPLSLNGEHSYANTQLLCRKCNGIKSNKFHHIEGGGILNPL